MRSGWVTSVASWPPSSRRSAAGSRSVSGHLTAHLGRADGPPLVLVAHMDTVWPAGTLPSMPFRVEDGYAWGPGALDMKAGIVIALEALRAAGRAGPSRCTVLITADEEIGSPTGRPLVEEVATGARAVLVLEPPVKDGTITTSRSGLARYQLHIRGRAAHAGNGSRAGVSAIEELAHQITAVHGLSDPAAGIRTNVGQVGGGTGDNVVAGRGLGADRRPRLDGRRAALAGAGAAGPAAASRRRRARGHRRRHPAADGAVAGGRRAGPKRDRDRRTTPASTWTRTPRRAGRTATSPPPSAPP